MKRSNMIKEIGERQEGFDIIIIGGGATGLGVAVDSASRGLRTLLLEQGDFTKGTSSKSTKLIHGGVRYLQSGNFALVKEGLEERSFLLKNAPHIVHPLQFLVPSYHFWESSYYGLGLKIYDFLAGDANIEPSSFVSKKEALKMAPTIVPKNLYGGVVYQDAQFDDARLGITLAKTFAKMGGVIVNYMPVTSFIKENEKIIGVQAKDLETNNEYKIYAKSVINATGVFVDHVRQMDVPETTSLIQQSQGVHLVLPKHFLPGNTALLIPHTDDRRVIFIIPWLGKVLLGTTDTCVTDPTLEPIATSDEIDFLLKNAYYYLATPPKREDILSVFAGLRPLIKEENTSTSALSRKHEILIDPSGLISVMGGKWTSYRVMGRDVIDHAILMMDISEKPSITETLQLEGYAQETQLPPFEQYGSNVPEIMALIKQDPTLAIPLHQDLPYPAALVVWAALEEMALTVEDVLARRTRALFLNAFASIEIAPKVASLMAKALNLSSSWEENQVKEYNAFARTYLIQFYDK